VIGIGRGHGHGRGQQACDEQDGRKREPCSMMPWAIHVPIVRAGRADGNASVVPAGWPRGPVPAGNAGVVEPFGWCDHLLK
jgi:hypothetical protein